MGIFSRKKKNIAEDHIKNVDYNAALDQIKEFLFFGNNGEASTRKFVDSYEDNPLVYIVVNKIVTTSASIKRIAVNEKGEEITNSEILALINNPNSYQGGNDLYEKVGEQLELAGNAFIRHIEGIGAGNELEVLESANVKLLIDKFGDLAGYEYTDSLGFKQKYDTEEVLQIKKSNSSRKGKDKKYWGISPLSALWTVVDASNDLFTARASTWKNRGIIGFLSNKSDTPILEPERKKIQSVFDKNAGGPEKANRINVTTANVDFVQVGMSPTDLKLLEGVPDSLRLISSGYKINSVLFNDVSGSTFNNVAEAKVEAYTDVYIPLAEKIDSRIGPWLSIRLKVNETIILDISKVEVLKSTTNPVANKLNNLPPTVANRILEVMTFDEARDIVGLEPTTDGKQLLGKSNGKEEAPKS